MYKKILKIFSELELILDYYSEKSKERIEEMNIELNKLHYSNINGKKAVYRALKCGDLPMASRIVNQLEDKINTYSLPSFDKYKGDYEEMIKNFGFLLGKMEQSFILKYLVFRGARKRIKKLIKNLEDYRENFTKNLF